MFGGYRKEFLPRVLHISIARYLRDLPASGKPLEFLVSFHEEGMGITWQQNVTLTLAVESDLLEWARDLRLWTKNVALDPATVQDRTKQLGNQLFDSFIGPEGTEYLKGIKPTAILLNVDETILNLPWELISRENYYLALDHPFGRLVTTRVLPKAGRDPLQEDKTVNMLVVSNPTGDLPNNETEVLENLQENYGRFTFKVDVLREAGATRENFREKLAQGDFDMLHFSCHGNFDDAVPEKHSLKLADGDLSADEVLKLNWGQCPPYFVFVNACQSGLAGSGQRLVSLDDHSNGLAAAFLGSGVYGYGGFYWPVSNCGASLFAKTFYQSLFERENVGLAFQNARKHTYEQLWPERDLTAFSAILFGDAASQHRRDLATAA